MKFARGTALALVGAVCVGAQHVEASSPETGGDLLFAYGFERPVSSSGGSNYLWYALGPGCDREPYGILINYAEPGVRATVQQQLAAMHAAGQRRLSIGQHFKHGSFSGTVIDSSDPVQVSMVANNLTTFLQDIHAAGISEVLFRLFPQDTINPSSGHFDRDLITEYWDFVQAMRAPLAASGVLYRYDLFAEGMPRDRSSPWPVGTPDDSDWSWAGRRLWENYTATFGKNDTVGFSFLTDDDPNKLKLRVRHMEYVYEGDYPYLVALDVYGSDAASESDKILTFGAAMRQYGFGGLGWIISEAYYDDPVSATDFSSAIAAIRPTVFYLTQWPYDRADTSCGDAVNVAPPVSWTVYGGYGF